MTRPSRIYVLSNTHGKVVAAFTVKYELINWAVRNVPESLQESYSVTITGNGKHQGMPILSSSLKEVLFITCRHGHPGWYKRRVKYDRQRDKLYWTIYCQECDRIHKERRKANRIQTRSSVLNCS